MKQIIFKHCAHMLTWPPTQIEFLTWSHNSSQSWSSARALTEINFRRVVCTAVSHTRCNIILQTHHSDMTDMTCFLMTRGRVHFNSRTQLESIFGYRVQVRHGHQHWLKISWPSNYQPDLAILKHEIFLQFGLFKEKITSSGFWQLESGYQLFGKLFTLGASSYYWSISHKLFQFQWKKGTGGQTKLERSRWKDRQTNVSTGSANIKCNK